MNKDDVKFTGKEYLAYLKYKDSKPKFNFSEWYKRPESRNIVTISVILIMFFASLITMYNIATYTPATPMNYTWEGIAMFVTVCLGIAWVIHGVGFHLVRVR